MALSKESDSFLGDIVSPSEVTGQLKIVSELHVSQKGPCKVLLGERMGKRVIIKTLKADYANDPQYLLLLRKEFEIGFSLSHPGIASILDYQVVESLGECIIEEYIDGESLDSFLLQDEIPYSQALHILTSIVRTLEYIHQKGISHADLKPSNIIISSFNGMPKIIDFGFSDKTEYVSLKFNGGSSGYIAPERRNPDYLPNPASDIWSMGVIIEMFANKIKGKGKHRLRKIAGLCKTPLDKRVTSTRELLNLLEKDGKKSRLTLTAIVPALTAFIIIAVAVSLFRPSGNDENNLTGNQIEIKEEIEPILQENEPVTSSNPTPALTAQKSETPDLSSEQKVTETLNTETEVNPESPYVDEEEKYLNEARMYTGQHIRTIIEDLKAKGLYRKAVTIGERWNSRYMYDKIIKEIEEYVASMPIKSETLKKEVTTEAVRYARQLLDEEEKKLEETETEEVSKSQDG